MKKVELLQDNIVVPYEHLQRTSSSLEATLISESLQFRERRLFHVSDDAFNFFLALEQERVNQIKNSNVEVYKTVVGDHGLGKV